MANKERTFRKQFIEDHWLEHTDEDIYKLLLGTKDPAPSIVSITRMRQRMDLIRDKENIYKLRDKK